MLATLLRFGITVAAIPLCARFMDGVHMINQDNALVLGLVLAILYTLLRPFLRFVLKLPNFFTLGLVYIVLDAMLDPPPGKRCPRCQTGSGYRR